MRKVTYFLCALSACLAIVVGFSACGSSPATDIVEEETDNNINNAVDRIEVVLSGDYGKFMPTVQFEALESSGKGLELVGDNGKTATGFLYKHYEDEPFSSASATVKGNYRYFNASVLFINAYGNIGKVTITGNIYKGGKLYKTYTQDLTINSSNNGAAVLLDENGFQYSQSM